MVPASAFCNILICKSVLCRVCEVLCATLFTMAAGSAEEEVGGVAPAPSELTQASKAEAAKQARQEYAAQLKDLAEKLTAAASRKEALLRVPEVLKERGKFAT